MSQAITFKCPSCGAYLEYDPSAQQMTCPYCGQAFTKEALDALGGGKPQAASFDARLRAYHCQQCGAEIVTDDTTAATRCYYCHSPVVLTDRLSGDFHPDGVIPFQLDKAGAMDAFQSFIRRKRFVDRRFFSADQLESFSGVYYPYWMGDFEGEGFFDGEGTRVSTHTSPKETVVITRHFSVKRKAKLSFRNLFRRALSKTDRTLSDGIHPYRTKEIEPFDLRYLSGFLAEKRDIESKEAQNEMLQEVQGYARQMLSAPGPYNSLNGNSAFQPSQTRMRYMLLPAWVLTWRSDKPGATYYYMMNGQTGEVCGKLPIDKVKLGLWAAGVGAAVAGLMCLGGALLW